MIRNWFRNFMIGRYGADQLNMALIVFGLVLSIVFAIINIGALIYVAYLPLVFAVFRMLSRNIPRRRAENDRFIRWWWPIRTKITKKFKQLKDRKSFHFYKCPSCGSTLRVPRGKGRIQITCPKCGERFMKNS